MGAPGGPLPTGATAASSSSHPHLEMEFVRTMQAFYRSLESSERRLAEKERMEAIRVEWQHVALVADRLLLVVFIAITIAVTMAVLLHAPHSLEFLLRREPEGVEKERQEVGSEGGNQSGDASN